MPGRADQTDGAVKERPDIKHQSPRMFHVVLLNDDYSTMQFVVDVLETVFHKSPAEAYHTMMQVHLQGKGVAGTYPWEVAETKADTVALLAKDAGFPLRAAVEEA
jgi:ATP-dependent Clp protease adaptor protein ClpS